MAETKCKRGFQSHVMCDCEPVHPLTPRENVKLKPCPFCGGEAVAGSNFDNDHYVMCGADCDRCGGMVGYMKTEMAAIENWNRRAALASSGDHAELARLTVVATDAASLGDGLQEAALTRFQAHANPATVLALLAENAALRESISRHDRQVSGMLRARLSAEARATEAERKLAEAVGLLNGDHEVQPMSEDRLDRILAFEEHAGMVCGPNDSASLTWADQRALISEAVIAYRARTFLSKEAERG